MRGAADRPGVAPNVLYCYVHGKAGLIDGLVDEVYAGLGPVLGPSDDWSGQLAALGQAIFKGHGLRGTAHSSVAPGRLARAGESPRFGRRASMPFPVQARRLFPNCSVEEVPMTNRDRVRSVRRPCRRTTTNR
jgi:hypothetical protein